jgi:hypothetical protein
MMVPPKLMGSVVIVLTAYHNYVSRVKQVEEYYHFFILAAPCDFCTVVASLQLYQHGWSI